MSDRFRIKKEVDKSHIIFKEQGEKILKDFYFRNFERIFRFRVSTDKEDMQEATDFVLVTPGDTKICCRNRYYECNFRDLTIRSYNKGNKTEIHKIREGYGDIYLYCWLDKKEKVSEYIIVDVHKLRKAKLLEIERREFINKDKNGKPDGTKLIGISLYELKDNNCILEHRKI